MIFVENETNGTIVATHVFGEDLPKYNATAWQSGCGYIMNAKGLGIDLHVIKAFGDAPETKEYVKREMERLINEKMDELQALLAKRVVATMEVDLSGSMTTVSA